LVDPFIADVLGVDESQFNEDNFSPHTIGYGYQDYTANYDKATSFISERWLKMTFDFGAINDLIANQEFDVCTYFLEGPNLTFYFPVRIIQKLAVGDKIWHYSLLSKGSFPPSIVARESGYQFEFHHVNHLENQLIVLPTDIHGGFTKLLHKPGLRLNNRLRYKCIRPLIIASLGKLGLTNICQKNPDKYERLRSCLESTSPLPKGMFHHLFDKIQVSRLNLEQHPTTILHTCSVSFEGLEVGDLVNLV
jgi:hypothetical protein